MTAALLKPIVEADEWRTAQSQFDRAAEIIKLEPWLREVLREVQREFTCNFPVKMDDGHLRIFTGYRVQHNINRGPAKGGIRYHPDVSLNEVKALAMWMTWNLGDGQADRGGWVAGQDRGHWSRCDDLRDGGTGASEPAAAPNTGRCSRVRQCRQHQREAS